MQTKGLTGDASLAEELTEILRGRIITGEYQMGEKLVENKIARELKVSRTPVRDAFKQLVKEQLIEYIPNKGCFAKGFGRKDMEDIYEVRKAVEQLAVVRAIRNGSEEEIAALKKMLEIMSLYTEQNLYDKLLSANEDFHNTIYHMSGSRFIVQVLRSYQEYVHLARKSTLAEEANLPDIYEEHVKIYEAIAARDEDAAVAAIGEHLDRSSVRAMARWAK